MSDDTPNEFIKEPNETGIEVRLGEVLAAAGMTQAQLGDAIGLHPNNVNRLVNGHLSGIRLGVLGAICRVLNCQVGDILVYTGEPSIEDLVASFTVPDSPEGIDYEKRTYIFTKKAQDALAKMVVESGGMKEVDCVNRSVQIWGEIQPYINQGFDLRLVKGKRIVGIVIDRGEDRV